MMMMAVRDGWSSSSSSSSSFLLSKEVHLLWDNEIGRMSLFVTNYVVVVVVVVVVV